jgi:hypothetical protein
MSKDHVSDLCSALIHFPLAIAECAGLSSMRVARPAAAIAGSQIQKQSYFFSFSSRIN